MSETGRRTYVQSDSNVRVTYVVTIKNGEWRCSCPHWIYRRLPYKHIAHVKQVKEWRKQK